MLLPRVLNLSTGTYDKPEALRCLVSFTQALCKAACARAIAKSALIHHWTRSVLGLCAQTQTHDAGLVRM